MSSECWWQDRVLLVGCKSCIIPKAPMTHGFKDKSGTFNEHLTRITPSVSSVFPMHAQAQKNLKVECQFSWSTMCFTRAFHSSELGSHLMKASSIHQAQFWPCKSFKLWRTPLGDSWWFLVLGFWGIDHDDHGFNKCPARAAPLSTSPCAIFIAASSDRPPPCPSRKCHTMPGKSVAQLAQLRGYEKRKSIKSLPEFSSVFSINVTDYDYVQKSFVCT